MIGKRLYLSGQTTETMCGRMNGPMLANCFDKQSCYRSYSNGVANLLTYPQRSYPVICLDIHDVAVFSSDGGAASPNRRYPGTGEWTRFRKTSGISCVKTSNVRRLIASARKLDSTFNVNKLNWLISCAYLLSSCSRPCTVRCRLPITSSNDDPVLNII